MCKQKYLIRQFFSFILLGSIALGSCRKNENPTDTFDRESMLAHVGDQIILERYSLLQSSVNNLHQSIVAFTDSPDISLLTQAQEALFTAQKDWQACSTFEFGPAGMTILRTKVNTYPIDSSKILQNISSGTYQLDGASNTDTKGFPAIDYLLYGVRNTETRIVEYYDDPIDGPNRIQYILNLSNHIKSHVEQVTSDWQHGYADEFKSMSGTDVGSSLGMLVNEMNLDFERFIRDGKIGIPLGVRSLGTPQPEKTEAYYSGNSIELTRQSILYLKDLYIGKSLDGTDGLGLDDYLRHIEARHNNLLLADVITQQFDAIIDALELVNIPLSEAVISQPDEIQDIYDAMQQMIVLLKVDLSSSLGILITYQDNDGD